MTDLTMLSPDEARLLDRLTLGSASRSTAAASAGLRRARTRGPGLEFHEYRHYEPGDDPRSIDWTVEARLNQLVVRVSRAEGHLRLHVLLDVSASMSLGTPDKLTCAKKIAAALCYVAVERRDAAGMSSFGETIHTYQPPAAGRSQLVRVFETLGSAAATGKSAIDRALLSYGAVARGPGLVVILSDFFEPGGGLQGLRYLLHRGLTPAVVQIVAPEELEPQFFGETELVDVEDAEGRTVVVDQAMIGAYRTRLAEHTEALHSFCLAHGLPWLRVESTTPFKQLLPAIEAAGLFSAT